MALPKKKLLLVSWPHAFARATAFTQEELAQALARAAAIPEGYLDAQRIHAHLRHLDTPFRAQWLVLALSPPRSLPELARATGANLSQISRHVAALVDDGWLVIEKNPRGRRVGFGSPGHREIVEQLRRLPALAPR